MGRYMGGCCAARVPEEVRVAPGYAPLGLGVDVASRRRRPVAFLLPCERKGDDARAPRHVALAQVPVHCLGGPPGNLHFFRHLGPHFGFKPVIGRTCESVILRNKASSIHSLRIGPQPIANLNGGVGLRVCITQ